MVFMFTVNLMSFVKQKRSSYSHNLNSFDSFIVSQTASCSWFLKTSLTKHRATKRGPVSLWRRSVVWKWDSGMKVWLSPWPSSAWTRLLCWASTARRPCRRGMPACDTAWEKVRRTHWLPCFLLKFSRNVNYFEVIISLYSSQNDSQQPD